MFIKPEAPHLGCYYMVFGRPDIVDFWDLWGPWALQRASPSTRAPPHPKGHRRRQCPAAVVSQKASRQPETTVAPSSSAFTWGWH